jgi:Ca2+-binding EF-hand superfamily protein
VIADPDDTEQSFRVFDDFTAGRISIDEIRAIEDPSGWILRGLSKLSRR